MSPAPGLLSHETVTERLGALPGWERLGDGSAIEQTFTFTNFHETMAFVNALAWVAHHMDHHPDFLVGYKTCRVTYTTHSAGGITLLDLEAASRLNDLLAS